MLHFGPAVKFSALKKVSVDFFFRLKNIFQVGAYEEKCPTLTVDLLAHGPFFVHLFDNLNYGCPKHARKRQNLVQNKTDVQNLENIIRIPFGSLGVFILEIFSAQ